MRNFFLLGIALPVLLSVSCNKKTDTSISNDLLYGEMRAVCDSMIENTHVPGLVAGVWAPERGIVFIYASGLSDLQTGAPMDEDFHFRIGSNTKTAVISRFLQLVDSGYVSLQSPLSDYYPDFPKSGQITMEMLSDMTSGITSYTQNDDFQLAMYNDPDRVWSMDELIDYSRETPFHFEPGQGIDYCNTNTILIGRIIEMITGEALEEQLRKHIINFLGLEATHYYSSGTSMPSPHPMGYYSGSYEADNPEYSEFYDISWAQAAGAMVSTLHDLKIYVEALARGDFLSDSLQKTRMDKKILFREPDVYYSIGAAWFGDYYGHDGGLPGFTSTMVHSPAKNCTIIVWFNCNLDTDKIHTDHIFNRFDEMIFGK